MSGLSGLSGYAVMNTEDSVSNYFIAPDPSKSFGTIVEESRHLGLTIPTPIDLWTQKSGEPLPSASDMVTVGLNENARVVVKLYAAANAIMSSAQLWSERPVYTAHLAFREPFKTFNANNVFYLSLVAYEKRGNRALDDGQVITGEVMCNNGKGTYAIVMANGVPTLIVDSTSPANGLCQVTVRNKVEGKVFSLRVRKGSNIIHNLPIDSMGTQLEFILPVAYVAVAYSYINAQDALEICRCKIVPGQIAVLEPTGDRGLVFNKFQNRGLLFVPTAEEIKINQLEKNFDTNAAFATLT